MVQVVDLGLAAAQAAHGGGEAALELVVVVAVQEIVLAIVLVVEHELDAGEGVPGSVPPVGALAAAPVGIAAPGQEGRGEVGVAAPAALVDQRLQPGPVGAGRAGEEAQGRRVGGPAAPFTPATSLAVSPPAAAARGFCPGGLVERGDGADGIVQELHLVREGIAEEAETAAG